MKTKIGLADKTTKSVAAILNEVLSDEFVLYAKARKFHWNVTGSDFSELHKFFEAQYEQLDEIIDQVAERARSIGATAFGTLKEFSDHTHLKEHPGQNPVPKGMLAGLLADHETIIRRLRNDLDTCAKLGDMGTSDFLTGLMERHEKMAWMTRAYLS